MRMDKPKIYLETTMFSFYYEKRTAPPYLELKAEVRRIFELIKAGEYEPYTSPYAVDEIMKEPDVEKREKMEALIKEYGVKLLDITDETKRFIALYIQKKAIPPACETDAAHIAMTTVNGLDFIVSLNFTHIARAWTDERVRRVNVREGYQGIGIYKPAEVLEIYEDGTGLHE
jgi:Zn ribbon nucleic-acid-binding protein